MFFTYYLLYYRATYVYSIKCSIIYSMYVSTIIFLYVCVVDLVPLIIQSYLRSFNVYNYYLLTPTMCQLLYPCMCMSFTYYCL